MPKLEMMLQHGWGLNYKMWKKMIKFFPEIEMHFLDRGYFYQEKSSFFTNRYSLKIGIVHSFGLHLFPKDYFSSLDVLVIFSSFLSFHKDSSSKVLSLMKNSLKKNPHNLLKNFYEKAFNQKALTNMKKIINKEKLQNDLDLIGKISFDINLIKDIPKILLFHSKQDKIISFEKALEIKHKIENVEFYVFESFSHMLPITHTNQIVSIIKRHLPQEEKIFKEKIIHSFTKQIGFYEKNNHFQKKANEDLIFLLKKTKVKGVILEIGAGTGNFTKSLINHHLEKKIEITDLCPSMVNYCKRLYSARNTFFYVLDGEKLDKSNNYAMIASAMTLQWFYDLEKSFSLIRQALKKNGLFLFSFLEKDSFCEWKNINTEKILLNPLPSIEEIETYLKKNLFSICHLEKKSYTVIYPSIISFLQNLKKTGANASLFQSPKNFYSLMTLAKKQKIGPFPITYKVGVGLACK